jgi:hypothetical protein
VFFIISINVLGFAFGAYLIDRARQMSYVSVGQAVLSTFFVLFGDFTSVPKQASQLDADEPFEYSQADFLVNITLLVFFLFFVVVLVLNLLVAILGQSFSAGVAQSATNGRKDKIQLILELEHSWGWIGFRFLNLIRQITHHRIPTSRHPLFARMGTVNFPEWLVFEFKVHMY